MSSLLHPLASIDKELADRLEKDERFRNRYLRRWAQTEVATEIRALRSRRKMRQGDVARLASTGQSAISRIEKAEYDGWTFKTLMGIAEVLSARLRITFEPIEDVISNYRAGDSEPVMVETNAGCTNMATGVAIGACTSEGVTVAVSSSSASGWMM